VNHAGKGKFRGFSAGSFPTGVVNPVAIELLRELHLPTDGLRSKSWNEFSVGGPGAPTMDFIFTVCDNAAGEVCAVWPGRPTTAHWGQPDPAAVEGSEVDRTDAFREAYKMLERRIDMFTSLPIASLDQLSLGSRIREIGTSQ